MLEKYDISPRGYLYRARTALVGERPESLFYAALELRCCVERRQADYAHALLKYKGTQLKPWNVGKNRAKIRGVTASANIAYMRFTVDGESIEIYHTPVTDELVRTAERLGELLHCQTVYRPPESPWWQTTRNGLVSAYRLAWTACKGQSNVPPLWDPKTQIVHPVEFELTDDNRHVAEKLTKGAACEVKIAYLDGTPAEWLCDL
jgi:hypothetical protein